MLGLDTTIGLGALISMAVAPIYLGAYGSLWRKPEDVELLETKDAWRFPLIASSALFGLYVLFYYFSKEYVNYLLLAYFMLVSLAALGSTISENISWFRKDRGELKLFKWSVSWSTVLCVLAALPIGLWYGVTKHWLANNVFGLVFSIQGVQQISVSFKTGCMVLWALFFYDIFWVFGTPVMVTVATKLDGPIKVIFPKNLIEALLSGQDFQQSLLGLGDIVIPGMFLAMLLRFDVKLAKIDIPSLAEGAGLPKFARPYFTCGLAAYFLGLVTTMGVMVVFRAAQPALLYLVPACTIGPLLLALKRGELSLLLDFSEDEKIKKAKQEQEDADKAKQAEAEGKSQPKDDDDDDDGKKKGEDSKEKKE